MKQPSRWLSLLGVLVFVVTVVASLPRTAEAAQITSRKLTLMADTDQGSKPGGVVKHQFDFTLPTAGNVGSIAFQYCTTAAGTCTMPTGLVTTSATLDAQSGITGFTLNNSTNGTPYVALASASNISANTAVSIRLAGVTNPTTTNLSFYVRIASYASLDTTGSSTDTGVVAASTATQIVLTGTMPESLIFCTGAAINTTGGVPDCSTASAGAINFDRLFSPSDTATATSQMAASTNATNGYVISLFGNTMQSGAHSITAMSSATTSTRGIQQFGTNLRANTTATSSPAFGIDIAPSSNGTNFKGEPLAGYNTPDTFKFNSTDNIADSANGTAGPTDAQIYTNSYIVNVSGSTYAGTYTTTLTYICTPSF